MTGSLSAYICIEQLAPADDNLIFLKSTEHLGVIVQQLLGFGEKIIFLPVTRRRDMGIVHERREKKRKSSSVLNQRISDDVVTGLNDHWRQKRGRDMYKGCSTLSTHWVKSIFHVAIREERGTARTWCQGRAFFIYSMIPGYFQMSFKTTAPVAFDIASF